MKRIDSRRRAFLRAAGISVALPALPSSAKIVAGQTVTEETRSDRVAPPRRMVCVGNEFGMYPGAFWPTDEQLQDRSSRLLDPLAPHREHFTLFRHLDHGVKGGHFAVHTFLTGVKATEAKGMPEAGMSLDQRAAEHVGSQTRFPSLTIGSESGLHGGCRMSWTRSGTRVPPIEGPRELFAKLFVDGGESAKQQMLDRISFESSILDTVLEDANALSRRLNSSDRAKLDEYLSSIRDVELKLTLDRKWQHISKPNAPIDPPVDEGLTKDLPKIYDLVALALQTDSTRIATIEVGGSFAASDLGIKKGYHALSHHGQVQENIEQLVAIELYQVEQFARFLERLRSIREPNTDGTLLDHTMALFGSGMGNANSHTNHDLPVILAGGGFRHGRTLSLPEETNQRVPLTNLFVSMLQQFGVETDTFATSTGTLRGLESSQS
ncbi:DUF1552 domain-containing protein [Neorhodopirellula pilleata]|uniref:Secreted protein containing DUF1552 n=1 Tax=Neorhodopirellula pilleata TaxID=2714738 RepID=A0A5C6AFC0_9BACT|nr:DUF1552 domain-containing protein [Neorhodopirellula pilleata]TWT98732.1 hypothetical protein Pla100_18970 [Neorhodopirellula pilleata]